MPPVEAWERVYVQESFLTTTHGKLGCISCHAGDPNQGTKNAAHIDIVAAPSNESETYCSGCHAGTVANDHSSLHRTQEGYFTLFEKRAGYDIRDNEHQSEEFDKECGKCHTTCGQCHVSKPISVGGGFVSGHEFRKTPHMTNNCTACHGSRVGAEFRGDNEGLSPDTHYQYQTMRCEACHEAAQLHGPGFTLETRYDDNKPVLPKCEECHEDARTTNAYHQKHWADGEDNPGTSHLQCQVCHSQEYKNCNACHVGGDGITGSSYMKFKIGKNYRQTSEKPYDYAVVRHIPIAPDTYNNWGVSGLPNFDDEPTWKYATPHNIRRFTARTDTTGGGSCWKNCHNNWVPELDTYLRANDDDMQADYDYKPNENVVIPN